MNKEVLKIHILIQNSSRNTCAYQHNFQFSHSSAIDMIPSTKTKYLEARAYNEKQNKT